MRDVGRLRPSLSVARLCPPEESRYQYHVMFLTTRRNLVEDLLLQGMMRSGLSEVHAKPSSEVSSSVY
jgi:hypothetical protein